MDKANDTAAMAEKEAITKSDAIKNAMQLDTDSTFDRFGSVWDAAKAHFTQPREVDGDGLLCLAEDFWSSHDGTPADFAEFAQKALERAGYAAHSQSVAEAVKAERARILALVRALKTQDKNADKFFAALSKRGYWEPEDFNAFCDDQALAQQAIENANLTDNETEKMRAIAAETEK